MWRGRGKTVYDPGAIEMAGPDLVNARIVPDLVNARFVPDPVNASFYS